MMNMAHMWDLCVGPPAWASHTFRDTCRSTKAVFIHKISSDTTIVCYPHNFHPNQIYLQTLSKPLCSKCDFYRYREGKQYFWLWSFKFSQMISDKEDVLIQSVRSTSNCDRDQLVFYLRNTNRLLSHLLPQITLLLLHTETARLRSPWQRRLDRTTPWSCWAVVCRSGTGHM